MKKFKKLIPAFCMLLVSAVMLGTSTFAWFSMNTTVTAKEMKVTAKSQTEYFVISTTENDVKNSTATGTEVTFSTTPAAVQPVAYNGTGATITAKNNTTAENGKWYTASSDKYNEAQGTTPAAISNGNVTLGETAYFTKYEFYVGLAGNSTAVANKLNVKVTKDGAVSAAVKAAVVVTPMGDDSNSATDTMITWTDLSGTGAQTAANYNFEVKGINESAKYAKVTVYAYVDGTDAGVTSNAGTIEGALTVTVTGVSGD